jgi:hypothetical protein
MTCHVCQRLGVINKSLMTDLGQAETVIRYLREENQRLRDDVSRQGSGRIIPRGAVLPPAPVFTRSAPLPPAPDAVPRTRLRKQGPLWPRIVAVLIDRPDILKTDLAVEVGCSQDTLAGTLSTHRAEIQTTVDPHDTRRRRIRLVASVVAV